MLCPNSFTQVVLLTFFFVLTPHFDHNITNFAKNYIFAKYLVVKFLS